MSRPFLGEMVATCSRPQAANTTQLERTSASPRRHTAGRRPRSGSSRSRRRGRTRAARLRSPSPDATWSQKPYVLEPRSTSQRPRATRARLRWSRSPTQSPPPEIKSTTKDHEAAATTKTNGGKRNLRRAIAAATTVASSRTSSQNRKPFERIGRRREASRTSRARAQDDDKARDRAEREHAGRDEVARRLAAKAMAERTMKTSRDHQTKPPRSVLVGWGRSRVNVAARIVTRRRRRGTTRSTRERGPRTSRQL